MTSRDNWIIGTPLTFPFLPSNTSESHPSRNSLSTGDILGSVFPIFLDLTHSSFRVLLHRFKVVRSPGPAPPEAKFGSQRPINNFIERRPDWRTRFRNLGGYTKRRSPAEFLPRLRATFHVAPSIPSLGAGIPAVHVYQSEADDVFLLFLLSVQSATAHHAAPIAVEPARFQFSQCAPEGVAYYATGSCVRVRLSRLWSLVSPVLVLLGYFEWRLEMPRHHSRLGLNHRTSVSCSALWRSGTLKRFREGVEFVSVAPVGLYVSPWLGWIGLFPVPGVFLPDGGLATVHFVGLGCRQCELLTVLSSLRGSSFLSALLRELRTMPPVPVCCTGCVRVGLSRLWSLVSPVLVLLGYCE
ncbi:hypothetical protein Taro_054235 [Colocasia esculenta]|uniref:Uncharacterized protein n=1 Tax=Colocasia esculenta TaxID=4460 RepID=A0A843XQ39_COLES|nr:hypothetical protein [Colocasia esculenta]